jgi:type II secretory pathway component GspD/PulD (secretin)
MRRSKYIVSVIVSVLIVGALLQSAYALNYTVQRGDKLEHIATRFGVNVDDIIEANNITDKNLIITGQTLIIPGLSDDNDDQNNYTDKSVKGIDTEVTGDSDEHPPVMTGQQQSGSRITNVASVVETGKTGADTKTLISIDELINSSQISLNVKEADVRDVLSAIAVYSSTNILFKGQPIELSLRLDNVTVEQALDSLSKVAGMDWIRDDNIIVFGDKNSIIADFSEILEITEFKLKYITSETLADQINALGLNVSILKSPANSKSLWVQGFASDLVKIRQILRMIDKNANLELGSSELKNNFKPLTVEYISASEFKAILEQLSLPSGFILEGNSRVLYIYASNEDFQAIDTVRSIVDVIENYSAEGSYYTSKRIEKHTLNNITSDVVIPIFAEMSQDSGLDIRVFTPDKLRRTLWLVGSPDAISEAKRVINDIDTSGISDLNTFEVFRIYNVTADEMEKKLMALDIPKLRIYKSPFSQFGKTIMVSVEADYMETLSEIIDTLDIKSPTISLPVDYSTAPNGASRLHNRRVLIAELSGIPASQFKISSNIAKGDGYRYVMYLTASPEEIQRVRDLITEIDRG